MEKKVWMLQMRIVYNWITVFRVGFIAAAAIASLLAMPTVAKTQESRMGSTSRPAISGGTQTERDLQKTWRKGMSRKLSVEMKGPTECFHAKYPSNEWKAVACVKAPNGPRAPAHSNGVHTNVVGNGSDYVAQTSSLISSAEGSFVSFSGVTSIGTATGPFSLQLNSNYFTTPACNGISRCQGWQQFFFGAPGTSNPEADAVGFIQYWLVNYGANCPTNYSSYQGSCYMNERGGLGFSDRSISGMTAIFFNNSRSDSDETTETQPLAGLQGESGFGSLER